MASLANGSFSTRLGFHLLNTEEREPKPSPEGAGLVGMGQPTWAFLGLISAHFSLCSIFCILDHGPLQLWALDVIISAAKLGDLYA
jgi:hypothetical protein